MQICGKAPAREIRARVVPARAHGS